MTVEERQVFLGDGLSPVQWSASQIKNREGEFTEFKKGPEECAEDRVKERKAAGRSKNSRSCPRRGGLRPSAL